MSNTVKFKKSTGRPLSQDRIDSLEHEIDSSLRTVNDAIDRQGNWTERRVKSDYSARPADLVLTDASGGGFSVVLPDHTKYIGQWITVKETAGSTNPVTIKSIIGVAGTTYIDGANSLTVSTPRQARWFRATHDGWHSL